MTETLRERLKALPDKPGCYLMRDRRGRIIYVGKALSLRRRVQSYFRPATLHHGDPKLRGLVNSVHDLEWIVTRTEDQALLTENELIKQHLPRYNILLRDDKRYLAIRCDPRDPLPRLTTCRLLRNDGALYFGPFPSGGRFVRPVIDYLEKTFGLRRCTPIRPDAETYRHCHDDAPVRHRASAVLPRRNTKPARWKPAPCCRAGARPSWPSCASKWRPPPPRSISRGPRDCATSGWGCRKWPGSGPVDRSLRPSGTAPMPPAG